MVRFGCFRALFIYLFVFYSLSVSLDCAAHSEALLPPKSHSWSFNNFFGDYDKQQLRRGFTVYRQSCGNCHSLRYVTLQNLQDIGYNKAEVAAIAKYYNVSVTDHIPDPFKNSEEARQANNGALPPDLSTITRARAGIDMIGNGGADYVSSVLTGYASDNPQNGTSYINPYFANGKFINMPPPLIENMIDYKDGTNQSVENYASDVAAFLQWCATPHLQQRRQVGFMIILFLIICFILLFMLNRSYQQKNIAKD